MVWQNRLRQKIVLLLKDWGKKKVGTKSNLGPKIDFRPKNLFVQKYFKSYNLWGNKIEKKSESEKFLAQKDLGQK